MHSLIELMNPEAAEAVFEDRFQEIVTESTRSVFAFARTLENPWEYMQSVLEDIASLEEHFPEEYTEFVNKAHDWLDTLDSAFTSNERAEIHSRWDEGEYDPYTNMNDYGYDARTKSRDVWDIDSPVFYREVDNRKSREIWQRVTKDDSTSLRIMCDYGNFDWNLTEKYQRAALRIRTTVRSVKGTATPFLSVGAVQINMRSGVVNCGVQGCNHSGQLSVRKNESGEIDREWLEYQVLRILSHLGEHGKAETRIFPKFLSAPNQFRDTAADKWASRARALFPQAFASN